MAHLNILSIHNGATLTHDVRIMSQRSVSCILSFVAGNLLKDTSSFLFRRNWHHEKEMRTISEQPTVLEQAHIAQHQIGFKYVCS